MWNQLQEAGFKIEALVKLHIGQPLEATLAFLKSKAKVPGRVLGSILGGVFAGALINLVLAVAAPHLAVLRVAMSGTRLGKVVAQIERVASVSQEINRRVGALVVRARHKIAAGARTLGDRIRSGTDRALRVVQHGIRLLRRRGTKQTFYFRGTTVGYGGNHPTFPVTPTSLDPVVGTTFAVHAHTMHGNGVLYIASDTDLSGVGFLEGNVLKALEREVGVELTPTEFSRRAGLAITPDQALAILGKMGVSVPKRISGNAALDRVLKETARLSPSEIDEFMISAKAIDAANKKAGISLW
jgi:hypothetical protein